MNLPICDFDAKNALLCPMCESKLEDGTLTKADVEASMNLVKIAKKEPDAADFTLFSCREINGDLVLTLAKKDIAVIRQSRTMHRVIQSHFDKKIWLVDADNTHEKFIENLLFPTKVLSFNSVWAPGGIQKTKAVISGKWSPKFPINTDDVIQIVKCARNIDIEIEFEKKWGR